MTNINIPKNSIIIPVYRIKYDLMSIQYELRCYTLDNNSVDINVPELLRTHNGFQFVIIIDITIQYGEYFTTNINGDILFEYDNYKKVCNLLNDDDNKYYKIDNDHCIISEGFETDPIDNIYKDPYCKIDFGSNLVIIASNCHNGYYPHTINVLDKDDGYLFRTCF
jgi:hypothetical protein